MPLHRVSVFPLSQLLPVMVALCTYALNSSSPLFDHLEWLLNGTIFKTGVIQNTNLQLLIQPITFVHAGWWECRAVYSDSTESSPVNAGVVTVFSECYIELQYTCSIHVHSKLMMHDVHTN